MRTGSLVIQPTIDENKCARHSLSFHSPPGQDGKLSYNRSSSTGRLSRPEPYRRNVSGAGLEQSKHNNTWNCFHLVKMTTKKQADTK